MGARQGGWIKFMLPKLGRKADSLMEAALFAKQNEKQTTQQLKRDQKGKIVGGGAES